MPLVIDLDSKPAQLLLGEMADRLQEPGGMRRLMADILADYQQEVFATAAFGAWAALDAATVRAKRSGRVMVDTGNLLSELTNPKVEGESVVVDAGDATYAIFHQTGRGVPKRDPAPEPPESFLVDLVESLLDYIETGRA